jgi:hypothetical protein
MENSLQFHNSNINHSSPLFQYVNNDTYCMNNRLYYINFSMLNIQNNSTYIQ